MLKYFIIGVIVFAIIGGFLFWKFAPVFNKPKEIPKASELTIWALWEDEKFIKPALDEYKKTHPDLKINYVFQTPQNYRPRVQTQIAAGQGPDILMIHNTWVPLFSKTNLLSAMPSEIMTMDEFTKLFYPVIKEDFTNYPILKYQIDHNPQVKESERQRSLDDAMSKQGKIYGIPRGIDGLALYYNEDLLKNLGAKVPENWFEFKETAYAATVLQGDENLIQTAGAAIGTTGNVDHWSDILGLLYLQQPGAKVDQPNTDEGTNVLKFYTQFVNPESKVWDNTQESSTQAFASGKLLFYFAPSWRAHELRQINPNLNFKIAPVPQTSNKKVYWANYWGYAVSAKSKFPSDAWELVKFLTNEDSQKLLYQTASNTNNRLFGLPYSMVSLRDSIIEDPFTGAFVEQAPYYKSWYLSSATRDQAINDEIIKYYEDAVNATVEGADPKSSLDTTTLGVEQVLINYFTNAPPAASQAPGGGGNNVIPRL